MDNAAPPSACPLAFSARPAGRAAARLVLTAAAAGLFAGLSLAAAEPAPAPAAPVAMATSADAPAAAAALGAELEQQVRRLALDGSAPAARPGARIEVLVGTLDARLRLAPCERIEPYLPPNAKPWGKTRIGLKCARGATPWNVYLPVTVKVHARGLAAASPLAAGTVLVAADLVDAEVDWAEADGAVLVDAQAVVGRALTRPLAAGQGVRLSDFKPRAWFAAGDPVKIRAVGPGFAIDGEGQALSAGVEGQPARVRTEAGRVVVGMPVAERRVDVAL